MNDPAQDDAELERLLDEAGQFCQPRRDDWNSLVARLAPRATAEPGKVVPSSIESRSNGSTRKLWPLALASAALVAIVLGSIRFLGPGPDVAQAMNLDVVVRRQAVEVTVFNATENTEPTLFMPLAAMTPVAAAPAANDPFSMPNMGPGQTSGMHVAVAGQNEPQGLCLVKDRRLVMRLKAGDNLVKFTDVAASVDPTSVKLTSDTDPVGTKVIEQNFEFDLASADALLKRYLGRRVACVARAGSDLYEGFLISHDAETLVLADRPAGEDEKGPRPKTQALARRNLKAVRFESLPTDLVTRPTLVWKLRAVKPGDHAMLLSYLCGHMVWQADYVVVLPGEPGASDQLDLKGWVSVDNRSGATYEQAALKLIAGDVNRVRDPWAPVPPPIDHFFGGLGGNAPGPSSGAPDERKEFVQRDLFEYKLYALNQPSTVKDKQIKQLSLLEASGVKAQRRFSYDPAVDATRASIELIVKNEEENRLGMPLPKGRVTFTAVDADGDVQLLGRDEIDHTAKNEELTLVVGKAFDIVCDFTVLDRKQPAPKRAVVTYRVRVRNHRDDPAAMRVVGRLEALGEAQVIESTDAHTRHDVSTLYFDFELPADREKVITYTVDYRQ